MMDERKKAERDSFVAAIRENFADDAARLAFSDWLAENGESGADILKAGGNFVWRNDWKAYWISWRPSSVADDSRGEGEFLLWRGPREKNDKPGARNLNRLCTHCGDRPKASAGKFGGVVARFEAEKGWVCTNCITGDGVRKFSKRFREHVQRELAKILPKELFDLIPAAADQPTAKKAAKPKRKMPKA